MKLLRTGLLILITLLLINSKKIKCQEFAVLPFATALFEISDAGSDIDTILPFRLLPSEEHIILRAFVPFFQIDIPIEPRKRSEFAIYLVELIIEKIFDVKDSSKASCTPLSNPTVKDDGWAGYERHNMECKFPYNGENHIVKTRLKISYAENLLIGDISSTLLLFLDKENYTVID